MESWIWDGACSIHGAKDETKFKDYIPRLTFANRLCDVFDDELNRTAKVRHISPRKMRDVTVALPPLAEQEDTVEVLAAVDKRLTLGNRKKEAFMGLFKNLLQQLMTAQVRVNGLELAKQNGAGRVKLL